MRFSVSKVGHSCCSLSRPWVSKEGLVTTLRKGRRRRGEQSTGIQPCLGAPPQMGPGGLRLFKWGRGRVGRNGGAQERGRGRAGKG